MAGILTHSLKKNLPLNLKTFASITQIPERSTYILKRRHAPLLRSLDAERHRRLKNKHFIYDVIQDTNEVESPNINVVLSTFVEGIGNVGDVISCAPHYARQSLLLPRKAVYATPENIEFYSKLKKDRPEKADFSSIYAGMTLRFLSKKVIPVFMSSEKTWTIDPLHIKLAFRIEGIVIPREAVKLLDGPIVGPDPMKEDKDFAVSIVLNDTETAPVRCRLFHITSDIGVSKLSEEFYLGKREAILKEQEELLNSMPLPEIVDNRPEANISLKDKYRIKVLN